MKLDRSIQFQRATQVDDGFSKVDQWANHGKPVWANKKDVSDAERFRADGLTGNLTTRFTVRWTGFSKGVTIKDRLVYNGTTFEIFGIKEIGRNQWLEITAGARSVG